MSLCIINKNKKHYKFIETLSHVDEHIHIVANVLEGRKSSSSVSSNQAVLDPNDGGTALFRMVC